MVCVHYDYSLRKSSFGVDILGLLSKFHNFISFYLWHRCDYRTEFCSIDHKYRNGNCSRALQSYIYHTSHSDSASSRRPYRRRRCIFHSSKQRSLCGIPDMLRIWARPGRSVGIWHEWQHVCPCDGSCLGPSCSRTSLRHDRNDTSKKLLRSVDPRITTCSLVGNAYNPVVQALVRYLSSTNRLIHLTLRPLLTPLPIPLLTFLLHHFAVNQRHFRELLPQER